MINLPISSAEYFRLVKAAVKTPLYPIGFRAGQAVFNELENINPAIAAGIRGTDIDPFYDDKRIPAFLTELALLIKQDKQDKP